MFKNGFDNFCWVVLVAASVLIAGFIYRNSSAAGGVQKRETGLNKAVEREMSYRARLELIDKIYTPVEDLRKAGNTQAALLKLDELIRKYPGEAHGHILQGELLREMGALEEAVASYVEGVKRNGDYVDQRSPLSRRSQILRVVEEGTRSLGLRSAANPDNRSLTVSRQKINYLKSRLAGGCE
jgi:tetratricopeptide (TPR) repeat protein